MDQYVIITNTLDGIIMITTSQYRANTLPNDSSTTPQNHKALAVIVIVPDWPCGMFR